MPKYLIRASYSQDGLKGLLKDGGTRRRSVVDGVIAGMGGKLEAFYYAFGDYDVVAIVEMPDEATVTALSLSLGATGSVKLNTTVLIDPATVDEATKKMVDYRPPGA